MYGLFCFLYLSVNFAQLRRYVIDWCSNKYCIILNSETLEDLLIRSTPPPTSHCVTLHPTTPGFYGNIFLHYSPTCCQCETITAGLSISHNRGKTYTSDKYWLLRYLIINMGGVTRHLTVIDFGD